MLRCRIERENLRHRAPHFLSYCAEEVVEIVERIETAALYPGQAGDGSPVKSTGDIHPPFPEGRLRDKRDDLLIAESVTRVERQTRAGAAQRPRGGILQKGTRAAPCAEGDKSGIAEGPRDAGWIAYDGVRCEQRPVVDAELRERRDIGAVAQLHGNPVPGDFLPAPTLFFRPLRRCLLRRSLRQEAELGVVPAASARDGQRRALQREAAFDATARNEIVDHPLVLHAADDTILAVASRRLLRTKDEIGADPLAAIDEFQAVAPVLLAHETIAVEVEMKSIVVDDGGAVENPVRKGNGAAREDLAHRAVDARILGPFPAVDPFEPEPRGALVDPRLAPQPPPPRLP